MKRGQAWGFDLIVAVMLFVIALVAFYIYAANYNDGQNSQSSDLEAEARSIASSLLSEGEPSNWNTLTVTKIGLSSDKQLNETKIALFKSLSETDYERTRHLFNTKRNWYVIFSETISVEGSPLDAIGRIPVEYTDLIKIERVSTYNNKPITIYVEVWQ